MQNVTRSESEVSESAFADNPMIFESNVVHKEK